jgi:hypothetical protein
MGWNHLLAHTVLQIFWLVVGEQFECTPSPHASIGGGQSVTLLMGFDCTCCYSQILKKTWKFLFWLFIVILFTGTLLAAVVILY